MTELIFSLLGPTEIRLGERSLERIINRKQGALLIYLLLGGDHPQQRDALADLLWPDSPIQAGRQNLRQALRRLSLNLGNKRATPPFLTFSRETIQFNRRSHHRADALLFSEQAQAVRQHHPRNTDLCPDCLATLKTAVSCYRGPLLADQLWPESPQFEDWLANKRERFQALALDALVRLSGYYERQGAYHTAVDYVRQQLELAPWREDLHEWLMRLLALDGRVGEALTQYDRYRRLLATEPETEPSPTLAALHQQLRSSWFDEAAFHHTVAGTDQAIRSARLTLPAPYRGLEAFTTREADLFFGREAITTRLLQGVVKQPLVAVIGASGSGKSSLVQAGLLPRLAAEQDRPWRVITLRPGSQPVQALTAALQVDDPLTERLLIVIDQFEELYTLCPTETLQRQFVDRLLDIIITARSGRGSRLLLTLRADFMGYLLAERRLADLLQDGTLLLGPMTRSELRRAIQDPARQRGVILDPEMVDLLLDEAGLEPGNLPLLEFALTRLWEYHAQAGEPISVASCRALGGVQGTLVRYADEVYHRLAAPEQAQARRVLLQMVQPTEGSAGARRPILQSELDETGRRMARYLTEARLVVTNRDGTGQPLVELAHEALIHHWTRLQGWLEEDRAFRTWQERLYWALRGWQETDRDEGALLRGTPLAQAEAYLAERADDLSEAERCFIQTSVAQRDRRLREVEAQRNQAHRAADVAHSLNLASNAQLALNAHNTDLALALALEANRIPNPPPQVRLTLAETAYAPGARRVFTGHSGPVQGVDFSPDGTTALSASTDQTLILWDVDSGHIIRRFSGHTAAVNAVAFSPTGTTALSASTDQTLILWDVDSGHIIRRFSGHTAAVNGVAFSPEGTTALSASTDQTLILWDVNSGHIIRRFSGHTAAVVSLAVSPDGRLGLSGAANGDVILWNIYTGETIYHLAGYGATTDSIQAEQGHAGVVWDVAFSPDGRAAYSASDDEGLARWNLDEAGLSLQHFKIEPASGVFSLAVTPDGRSLLTGLLDSRITMSTSATGEPQRHLLGHSGRVLALAVDPDGRTALSGAADGTLRLWDLWHGALLRHLANGENIVIGSYVNLVAASLDLSPDGRLGITGHWNGRMSLWDYDTGAIRQTLNGHTEMLFAGTLFSPDGRRVVSGSGDIFAQAKDNTVRVWDVATGQELQQFKGHTDKLWDIDLSADGRFVASGSHDGTLRLWNLQNGQGKTLLDVSPQAVRSLAFSPDSKTILAGLGKGNNSAPNYDLRLIETATGREVRRLVGHREVVASVAFSPDGRLAVSGGSEATLILWDVKTGQEIRRLVGHTGQILAVTFSPNGRMIASGSHSKTAIVWDMAGGAQLRRFPGHTASVIDLTFTPDGRTLLTADAEGGIREWRIDHDQPALLDWIAANRYVPELTTQQRAQYHVDLWEGVRDWSEREGEN